MIYPPRHFDLNEWTVLGILVVVGLATKLVKRRFSLSLCIVMIMFSIVTARVADHLMAGPAMADLYDVMDRNKFEWFDQLTYVMFSPFAYIFVALYDRWELSGLKVPLYVLCWCLLSTAIEWMLHRANVFVYKEWSTQYSFAVYMLVQPLTIWLFRFLKEDEPSYDKT